MNVSSHPPGDDERGQPISGTPDELSEGGENQEPELTGKGHGQGKKFVSDIGLTVFTEATTAALTLLSGILIARTLGPAGRGIYAVLVLVPMSLQHFGLLGLPVGIVHHAIKDPEGIGRRAANTLVAAIAVGTVLAGVGFFVLNSNIVSEFSSATVRMKTILLVCVPAILFTSYSQGVVLGLDDLVKRNLLRLIEVVVYFGFVVTMVVWLGKGLEGAVVCWAAGVVAASLLSARYMYSLAVRTRFQPDLSRLRADAVFGLKAYLSHLAFFMLLRCDQYLVAYFMDSTHVGFYSVAASLSLVMGILPQAVEQTFLPKVTARYMADGGQEDMTPTLCRLSMITSVSLALPMMVAAYPIVWLFYGKVFEPAAMCFIIMLPAGAILSALWGVQASMQARGAQIWNSAGALLGFLVNVALDLFLIPRYGINGAAAGTAIAYIVYVGFVLWRFLKIDAHLSWRDLVLPRRADFGMLWWGIGELVGKVARRA